MRSCESHLTREPLTSTSSRADKDSLSFLSLQAMLASLRVLLNLTHNNGQWRATPSCAEYTRIIRRIPS